MALDQEGTLDISAAGIFAGHRGGVYALCGGMDPSNLISAGSDGTITVWQPGQSQDGMRFAECGERIFCLLSMSSFGVLWAGAMNGDLFYIPFQDGGKVKRLRFHSGSIYRMASWKAFAIAVSGDGIVSIWNPLDGSLVHQMHISPYKLRSLAIDPIRDQLYAGDAAGDLHILSLPDLGILHRIKALHERTIFSLCYLKEEDLLVSGGIDARLSISRDGNLLQEPIKAHWFSINDLCPIGNLPYLASASRDKTIRIWDRSHWNLAKEISRPKFAAHSFSVNSLYWIENLGSLFSAGDDGMIFRWKIRNTHDT